MAEQLEIKNLRIELTTGSAYQRKAAVAKALELSQQGTLRETLRGLLQATAANDADNEVRAAAKAALADIDRAQTKGEAQHMVGVKCPRGHTHYYDKRRLCPDDGTGMRMRDELLDVIAVTCPTCDVKFQVKLDCTGYT